METELDCELSVAPRLTVGEPVRLRFRLVNRAARPVYVLKHRTPLQGYLGKFMRATRDGEELPYEGIMVKRGPMEANDYVAIAPGGTAEAEVELKDAYDFRRPGRYRIEFQGELLDVAEAPSDVPRRFERYQSVQVRCPAAETELVAR